jgi:hypothetical protein
MAVDTPEPRWHVFGSGATSPARAGYRLTVAADTRTW